MKRSLQVLSFVGLALVGLIAVGVITFLVLSRTEFGLERVRRYTVGWVSDRVKGELRIGKLTSRGLLGGVTLHDVSIKDLRGRPFLSADSAKLEYDWRTLIGGRVVFDRMTLFRPAVIFEQLPGDTAWNYEYIFPDTTPGKKGPNKLVLLDRASIRDGTVTIRIPWEPDPDEPVEPGDTLRLVLESVPGGLARVLRFENVRAELPRVLWESPIEDGKLLRIRRLAATGYVWREPFRLEDLRGVVTLRDSVIAFEAERVRFPASRASMLGRIVSREGKNFFDIRIEGRDVAFRDLRWLYPPLPAEGGGDFVFRIQSQRPTGTLWLVTDARLRAPGTRLTGSFGIVTGDSLYFTNVNLRASPLNLQLLEDVLPGELPVKGLLVGTVVVEGPLSSLTTRGDVRLAQSAPARTLSAARWRGTVDLRRPYATHSLMAEVERLDLALLDAFRPGLGLRGMASGRVHATGALGESARFAGRVRYVSPGGAASEFEGQATIAGAAGQRRVEAHVVARPAALHALGEAFPRLAALQGEATGNIEVRGPLSDLALEADLQTAGGRLRLGGRFDLAAQRPRYRAGAEAEDFALDRVVSGLPATRVSGALELEGEGFALADARTDLRLDVASGQIGELPLREASARLALRAGVLRLDTLVARTPAWRLAAAGSFGVRAGETGELRVDARIDSLPALAHLLHRAGVDEPAPLDELSGAVRVQARLAGGISGFDLEADATVLELLYRSTRARNGTLRVGLRGARGERPAWRVGVSADSLWSRDRLLTATRLDGEYDGVHGGLTLNTEAPFDQALHLAGSFERRGKATDVRVTGLDFRSGAARWRLAEPTRLALEETGVSVNGFELARADGARLRATGWLPWAGGVTPASPPAPEANFRLDFQRVGIGEFLRVLEPQARADGVLAGYVTVRGPAAAPVLNAEVSVSDVRYGEVRLERLETTYAYAGRKLNVRVEGRQAGRTIFVGGGGIPLDLALQPVATRKLAEPLDFSLRADSVPAALVTAFLDGFEQVEGSLDGMVILRGTTQDPAFGGSLVLRRGAATWSASRVRYRNVEGSFRVLGERVLGVEAAARTNGGDAAVTGTLTFRPLDDPEFDLVLRARDFEAARRRDVAMTGGGEIRLRGRYRRPLVSGRFQVARGALYLDELWREYQIVELESPILFDVVDTTLVSVRQILPRSDNPFLENMVVDGTLEVSRDFWLRSRDMNVELEGELALAFDRQAQDLRLTGDLNVVRGNYQLSVAERLPARRFEVRRGAVEFVGTPGIDPNLDILAAYRARTAEGEPLDIQARLSGTLRNPRVALTSDAEPPISESDLASYLIFGRPSYALAPTETQALGFFTNAVGLGSSAIVPSFLGYAAAGLETFVREYGFDYLAITAPEVTPGAAGQQSTGFPNVFAGTELRLGWYLSDNLFAFVSQRFAGQTGTRYTPGVRLEWRFHPTWSAEIFAEDLARAPGQEQTQEQRRVLGFFLFREWGY
ncbi:MAG: translocation/assembly module TamB domain-containing protein [Gemmatimonadetes bacterium]|nr:translocation/assembly module TamB domain-containing protein [Gemmatimonadota bacterium]